MKNLILFTMMILLMTIFLMFLGFSLPITSKDMMKTSPYECGFDPMNSPRLPFSFRFFLVAILFLIFDLEMALLLPFPLSLSLKSPSSPLLSFTMFLFILSLGLYYEWVKGGLEWAEK